MNREIDNSAASNLAWRTFLMLTVCCTLLCGCRARQTEAGPQVEFTSVPPADEGGPDKIDVIEGRVVGARPGQQVILFAHSGAWYVQPFADNPFTPIQPDAKWRGTTHLGTEYAALLVEPGYRPPPSTDVLPAAGDGVIAVSVVKGAPVFWQRWWFMLVCGLACLSALLAFYNYRLHRLTRQLNLRFEERLAERTRVAQELHDTFLQSVISASMQLSVAVERLPEDLPAKPALAHVLDVLGQVLEEGRNALQRLRSSAVSGPVDLEGAFSRIRHELAGREEVGFRVVLEGRSRPLHPLIRDEVYGLGREAIVNAFRHAQARNIEVVVEYKASALRVVIRDDGNGRDRSGGEGHGEHLSMRERAERIGARLKARSRAARGTEIELSVPGKIAFKLQPSTWLRKRFDDAHPGGA